MRILLLNPTMVSKEKVIRSGRCQIREIPGIGIWPPIDLAEVAANIKNEADEIKILDSLILNDPFERMMNRVFNYKPEVLILQSTTPTLYSDLKIAELLKSHFPALKIIFFGLHSTVRPEDILSNNVEFAVRGEPEHTIIELIRFLKDKSSISEISGISYYRNGKVFHNEDRSPIRNLDSLPFPARDLIDNKRYILPKWREPFTIIKTSRGCPYKCIFCTSSVYYGSVWRCRSAKNIVNEIKEVTLKYGIFNFVFLSDTFNLKKDFVLDLCSLIRKEGFRIRWACNSRVNTLTEETAVEMKESGCWLISFGIESGSEAILKESMKCASLKDAQNAVNIARKIGIKSLCYFIFGLPGETKESTEETIKFAKRLSPDYACFYTATPFPGTPLFKIAEDNGWLISKDWRRYFHDNSDVISYPNLSNKEISKAERKAYRSFYLQPKVILRELRSLKNLNQFIGTLTIAFKMIRLFWNKLTFST